MKKPAGGVMRSLAEARSRVGAPDPVMQEIAAGMRLYGPPAQSSAPASRAPMAEGETRGRMVARAISAIREYTGKDDVQNVEVVAGSGTDWAIQATVGGRELQFVCDGSITADGLEEVEFKSWPPTGAHESRGRKSSREMTVARQESRSRALKGELAEFRESRRAGSSIPAIEHGMQKFCGRVQEATDGKIEQVLKSALTPLLISPGRQLTISSQTFKGVRRVRARIIDLNVGRGDDNGLFEACEEALAAAKIKLAARSEATFEGEGTYVLTFWVDAD